MKNSKKMLSAAFALFVMLAPAFAQTAAIRVRVPFDFNVGKQILAAGDYRVNLDGAALQFINVDGRGACYAISNYTGGGIDQDVRPRLVFHVYGERHFLTEAWMGEGNMGHELSTSKVEQEYARNVPPQQTFILAASNTR